MGNWFPNPQNLKNGKVGKSILKVVHKRGLAIIFFSIHICAIPMPSSSSWKVWKGLQHQNFGLERFSPRRETFHSANICIFPKISSLLTRHFCYYSRFPICLKISEKVSFNVASEASYVYILGGQKFIKKCQKWSIWRVLKT